MNQKDWLLDKPIIVFQLNPVNGQTSRLVWILRKRVKKDSPLIHLDLVPDRLPASWQSRRWFAR